MNAAPCVDWQTALRECSSTERISTLKGIWDGIPEEEQPAALADAISSGDLLVRERGFLSIVLEDMRFWGKLVFDCEQARSAFAALPDRLTIYRGTVEAERPRYGVSWTLDRGKAEWFAKGYRCSNRSSPPVILQAEINKADAVGYLTGREESEILVAPDIFKWRHKPRYPVTQFAPAA